MHTHPAHYTFGMVTHAPTLLPKWKDEPFSLKIGFVVLYMYFFSVVGYSMVPNLQFAVAGASFYLFALFFMASGQMIHGRKGQHGFFYRLSTASLNASICFHGYALAHFLVMTMILSMGTELGWHQFTVLKAIVSLTVALFVLYTMQAAESFSDAKSYLVWLYPVIAMALIHASYLVSKPYAAMQG